MLLNDPNLGPISLGDEKLEHAALVSHGCGGNHHAGARGRQLDVRGREEARLEQGLRIRDDCLDHQGPGLSPDGWTDIGDTPLELPIGIALDREGDLLALVH